MGEDQYLLARIDGGPLVTVRDHTRSGAEPGHRVAITFDGDEVHLFNDETGASIPLLRQAAVASGDSGDGAS